MPFQMLFSVSRHREARPSTYSFLILKRTSFKKIPFLLRKHRGRKQALAGSLAKCETMRSSNNSSGGTCKWDNSFVMKVHTIRFHAPNFLPSYGFLSSLKFIGSLDITVNFFFFGYNFLSILHNLFPRQSIYNV